MHRHGVHEGRITSFGSSQLEWDNVSGEHRDGGPGRWEGAPVLAQHQHPPQGLEEQGGNQSCGAALTQVVSVVFLL